MIRSTLKRSLKKVLGREEQPSGPVPYPFKYEPGERRAAAPEPEPQVAAAPQPTVEAPVEASAEPTPPAAAEPAQEATQAAAEPMDDVLAGPALTDELVQELLDEMVRPALQADGGDISLVKIEDNDVYVRLVGSCSTCPSSIMTMKMGVEALFKEEFPNMGELVHVE